MSSRFRSPARQAATCQATARFQSDSWEAAASTPRSARTSGHKWSMSQPSDPSSPAKRTKLSESWSANQRAASMGNSSVRNIPRTRKAAPSAGLGKSTAHHVPTHPLIGTTTQSAANAGVCMLPIGRGDDQSQPRPTGRRPPQGRLLQRRLGSPKRLQGRADHGAPRRRSRPALHARRNTERRSAALAFDDRESPFAKRPRPAGRRAIQTPTRLDSVTVRTSARRHERMPVRTRVYNHPERRKNHHSSPDTPPISSRANG